MYAETDSMFQFFQGFPHEVQPLEEFSSLDNIITTSAISDYDLGAGGDLFNAPEPIIEKPIDQLDPTMTAAIAMISRGDDVIPSPCLKMNDIGSLQDEGLFCYVFDGYRNELFEKTSVECLEIVVPDVMDMKITPTMTNDVKIDEYKKRSDLAFTKSDSTGSLSSREWLNGANLRPNFLDFPAIDFSADDGMRRAFSEGDIKHSLSVGNCASEDRLQKLSRYRNKKSKRNFGRKIKYACRKDLADNQPRVRGRFAKTEKTFSCKNE